MSNPMNQSRQGNTLDLAPLPSQRSRRQNETLDDVTPIPHQIENDARWSILVCERDDLRKTVNNMSCQLLELENCIRESQAQTAEAERTIQELTKAQMEMKVLID